MTRDDQQQAAYQILTDAINIALAGTRRACRERTINHVAYEAIEQLIDIRSNLNSRRLECRQADHDSFLAGNRELDFS